MSPISQAKQLINDAKVVRIAVSPAFQQDCFVAALALFYSLKQLGKKVNLTAKNYPKKFSFLVDDGVFEKHQNPADVMVSIREGSSGFSHLFYEKEDGHLNIYINTNGGKINKDDISLSYINNFNKGVEDDELLIVVGMATLNEVENLLKPSLPAIINIDNSSDNRNYGEANLVKTNTASVSEIVFDLICSIEESPFSEQTANCLLAGILTATNNLQSPKITAGTFQKLGCLSEFGSSLVEIKSKLYGKISKGSVSIFTKILHRIKVNQPLELAWAILKTDDFTKSHTSPKDLNFALRKLTSGLFPFKNLLLIWPNKTERSYLKAIFYSQDKSQLLKIEKITKGERKGEAILFTPQEINGDEVKDKIIKALS